MFAGKLPARARAAVDRFGRVRKIRGRPVILRAAPLALAEEEGVVGRLEQPDELFFQDNSARVLDGAGIGRLGIRESLIDLHGAPPGVRGSIVFLAGVRVSVPR